MMLLGRKNLLKERGRLLVSIGGVAFAVLLIVLLRGVFVAYQTKIADYYEGMRADAWVVQKGTPDFVHAFSIVPDDARAAVAKVDGVAAVHPYLARQVGFKLNNTDVLLDLVGFDPEHPATGPSRIVAGSATVGSDGIVVDTVFASKQNVRVGDRLVLNGVSLHVTGISAGSDMIMYQLAYTSFATARTVLAMPDHDQALLVTLKPGAQLGDVSARIAAAVPDSAVYGTAEMVQRNQRPLNDSFVPIIGVLLTIGFLVGVAVVGLTTYSAVLEKRREYGMLKALGAKTGDVIRLVLVQSGIAAAAGYVGGVGLAFLVGAAAAEWVPQFVTKILPGDVALVALATVAMAAIASVVPLARIGRIDPAEVFRA